VVVVAFCTHGCINCVCMVRHLQRSADDLSLKGLTVLGVHAPEFDWEKDQGSGETFARRASVFFPTCSTPNV